MNQRQILKNLGLSEQEINIYLSLLKQGGAQASIIAKDTGIKRTTIYPILKAMAQKGFVNVYYRKNKQYYYAQKPGKIMNGFQKKLDSFESIIPMLESIEKKNAQMIGLRFIETLPELKEFYQNILSEYKNKEYVIIGSASSWEGLDPDFFIQFRKDRGQTNVKTRLLLTADSKDVNPTDPKLLRNYRFLPEKYTFRSTIDIFNDKILVVSEDLTSLAVVIAVPAMVDIFKSVFEILWDNTPTID